MGGPAAQSLLLPVAVSCSPPRKRETHTGAHGHYLHKPPARHLPERLSEDSNRGEHQERPRQKLLSASSPPPHNSQPFLNPCPHPFAATPHTCLAVSQAGQRGRTPCKLSPARTPPFHRIPPSSPGTSRDPSMAQAPWLSPLHRNVAHLSPLPQCAQRHVHLSDASSQMVLHGSFQELSWSCDPALAPLALEAPSCGH